MTIEVGILLEIDVQDCVYCENEYCLRGPFHVLKSFDETNIVEATGIMNPNGKDVVAWLLKNEYIREAPCVVWAPL